MTPEQMLENTTAYLKNVEKAKRGYVAVGLPSEEVGGTVYGDGQTVAQWGRSMNTVQAFPVDHFSGLPLPLKKMILTGPLLSSLRMFSSAARKQSRRLA